MIMAKNTMDIWLATVIVALDTMVRDLEKEYQESFLEATGIKRIKIQEFLCL